MKSPISSAYIWLATIIFVASWASTKAALFDICSHGGGGGDGGCPTIACSTTCTANGDGCGVNGFCRVKAESNSCFVCANDPTGEITVCTTDADCPCGYVFCFLCLLFCFLLHCTNFPYLQSCMRCRRRKRLFRSQLEHCG